MSSNSALEILYEICKLSVCNNFKYAISKNLFQNEKENMLILKDKDLITENWVSSNSKYMLLIRPTQNELFNSNRYKQLIKKIKLKKLKKIIGV